MCHVQLGMALMVNPPKEGTESYEQFMHEETSTMASLRRRAQIMTDGFNACEGVTCTFTEGAMYSFPRLRLPEKVRMMLFRNSSNSCIGSSTDDILAARVCMTDACA